MLTIEEIEKVQNATVFYPEVKVLGKAVPGLWMTKTLLKDGCVISYTFNAITKRSVMLIRKGFEKGVYRQRIQTPVKFCDIGLPCRMGFHWTTMANRIWLKAHCGDDLFEPEKHRILGTTKEFADYMYRAACALLIKSTGAATSAETSTESVVPSESAEEPPVEEAPARMAPQFIPYFLFEFRTGSHFIGDAVDNGSHFKMMDGREFDKRDYIGKPLDGTDGC